MKHIFVFSFLGIFGVSASAQMSEAPVGGTSSPPPAERREERKPEPKYESPKPSSTYSMPAPVESRPVSDSRSNARSTRAPSSNSSPSLKPMSSEPVFGWSSRSSSESAKPKRKASRETASYSEPVYVSKSSSRSSETDLKKESGAFLSLYYSTAKEGEYKGTATILGQNYDFNATEDSSTAPGLAGGYKYRPARGFGFNVFGAYEFPRKAKGFQGTAGNLKVTGTYNGDVTTSMLTGAGNGIWSYDTWMYFYGGVNYPFVMSNNDAVKLSGLPGYQVGIGSNITPSIGMHLEYRVVRMKGSFNIPPIPLNIDEARYPGWILSFDYSL